MNPLPSIRHSVDHFISWRVWAVLLAAVLLSSVAGIGLPAAYAVPPCAGPNPPPACDEDDSIPQAPLGAVTKVERSGGAVRVEGWTRDPDDGVPITVRVSIPPRAVGQLVDEGYGFSGSFDVQDGDRLCATAVNPQTGKVKDLGCHSIAALAAPTDLRVTVVHDRALAADWQDGAGEAGYRILLRRDGDWHPVKDVPAQDGGRIRMQVPVPVSGSHCIRVVAVVGVAASPPAEACETTLPAMPDRISMLNLNLQGTHQRYGPNESEHVDWEQRYDRVARWMQTTGTLPDLLALQEVYAFDWGDDAKPDVTDYETLFVLLDRIKARTNAEYRIAYLDTRLTEGVTMRAGNAVLYNADRLRNTTPQPGSPPAPAWAAFSQTLHARASHWCNTPPEKFRALCARIDGEGVYWTKSYTLVPGLGPSFSRFELRDHPGAPIHVYNVHAPNPRDDTEPEPSRFYGFLKSMVTEVEARWGSPSRLYPPIVAGDFNATLADEPAPVFAPGDVFGDFERAATSPNPDVVAILKGKVSAFPARHAGVAFPHVLPVERAEEPGRCGTAAQAWSDHCATFVDIVPSSSPAERWDLAEHLHRSPGAANPGSDRLGRAGVWRLLGGAGTGLDPSNDRLMPAFNPAHMGVPGLGCWRQDPGDVNSLPVICGNTRNDNPRPFGIDWPAGTVLMHPSPGGSAIVAWRSPYSGTVRIDGAVRDLHGACGDGIEWTIAAGGTTLATGAIPNGGQQDFSASSGAVSLRRVHVTQNETVYLAIGPGRAGDHACDSTGVGFTITSEPSWDLAEDYRRTTADANPFADRVGRPGVWRFEGSAGLAHDPPTQRLLPRLNTARFGGFPGLECWQDASRDPNVLPIVCLSRRADNPWPLGIDWQPGGVVMHPSPAQAAIVAWRSPISGTVRIQGAIRDLHTACGDGVSWRLASGAETLAAGAIPNGGTQTIADHLGRVHVRVDEPLYFVVGPGAAGDHGCDSTGVDLRITANAS